MPQSNKPSLGASVRQAGSAISGKEASQISKQTGTSAAQVFAKAQQLGIGINSGAINKFNAGALGPNLTNQISAYGMTINPRANAKTNQALSQLGALGGLRMQPGTTYMGYSTTQSPLSNQADYNPIIMPKSMVREASTSQQTQYPLTGGPYGNLDFKVDQTKPGPWAGGFNLPGTTPPPETTPPPGPGPISPVESILPEQFDYGKLYATSNVATGFRRGGKKGKQGIKSTSAPTAAAKKAAPLSNTLSIR